MNQNLAHLVIVSDRSGSMGASAQEAENAINALIKDQQNEDGDCHLTFVEFDGKYDVIADGIDIKDFDGYKLVPRGMTALYDAVGQAVATVGEKIAKQDEKDRPALVTVIISTDGVNNASNEYTQAQIAAMIKTQKEEFSWKFVFIGVEIDAESMATSMNIGAQNAVQITRRNSRQAYATTSNKLRSARSMTKGGASSQSINDTMSYTADEKKDLNK